MVRRTAAAAALVVLLASPLALAVEEPDWSANDTWKWYVFPSGAQEPGSDLRGYDNASAAVTSREGGNVTIETSTWRNATTANPIPGQAPVVQSTRTTVLQTYRTRDHALLQVVTTTSSAGGGISTSSPVTTTTTYADGCLFVPFPINTTSEWRVNCRGSTSSTTTPVPAETTVDLRYRVQERREVTTPAGTFHAYVIANVTSGKATDLQYFVPEVCHNVRTSSVDAQGKETLLFELVAFDCDDAGMDDYVPPPEPPADDGNETDDDATPPPPPPENDTDDEANTSPPPEDPPEEDGGLLGIPGPGALVAAAGAAAAAASRRRR